MAGEVQLIRDKEELARLIMQAAIEKVEALGFKMVVGNANSFRRVLKLSQIKFYHADKHG